VLVRLKFAGPDAAVLHDDEASGPDSPDSAERPVHEPVAWLAGLVALTALGGFIVGGDGLLRRLPAHPRRAVLATRDAVDGGGAGRRPSRR
jgi:hypothetical protein